MQDFFALAASTSDLHALPRVLLPSLVRIFTPDLACFYAKLTNKLRFRLAASYPAAFWAQDPIRQRYSRQPIDGELLSQHFRATAVRVVVPSPDHGDDGLMAFDERITYQAFIPVRAQDTIVGREAVLAVVVLSWFQKPSLPLADLDRLANTISGFVSLAYNNLLTRDRRERHIEFLRTFSDVSTTDPDSTYYNFLQALSRLVPTRFISLWLFDPENDVLVARAFHPHTLDKDRLTFDSFDNAVLSINNSISGEVVRGGRPFVISDLPKNDKFANRSFASKYQLKWFVSFPILSSEAEQPLGVINVWPHGEATDFDDDTRAAYSEYVQHMRTVVRLATLQFKETLLAAYDRYFTNLVSFEDDRLSWDRLCVLIRDQLQCDNCSIFVVDAAGVLRLKGTTGLLGNPSYDSVAYNPIVGDDDGAHRYEGLTGFALSHNEPVLYYREFSARYADVHISKYREGVAPSTSIILGQLRDAAGRAIGVIRCTNKRQVPGKRPGRFTHEDAVAIATIADLISAVHDKARRVWEKEIEQDRSFRSLHHEIVSPVDGILAHVDWIDRHFAARSQPELWNRERILVKFSDMRQIAKALENTVLLMGPFSTSKPLQQKPQFVYQLIRRCIGFIVNDARMNGVKLEYPDMFVSRVNIDHELMMRVFYNLLRNSIKYYDDNETERYIRVTGVENGDTVEICVEDNGIGMFPDEMKVVFERFKRGRAAPAVAPIGEGLGLFYCAEIVRRHGGRVYVRRPAKPTQIVVVLPIAEGEN